MALIFYTLYSYINRPINFCLILVSLLIFSSTIRAQPSLVFNSAGQPPLNTEKHDGFMDEVTREALRSIGYKLIVNRLPAERGLRNANNGLIDGEMGRIEGIDKTYKNLLRVPEKIMDWHFVVFSEKPIDLTLGWNSLANKNVAFITGWKILEKNVPTSAAITKTRNSKQLFYLLEKKRTDFIIYERWGGLLLINTAELSQVNVRQPALASREMFIYLHKKHNELVPRLRQALLNMKQDGSYEKLVTKHLSVSPKNN